MTGPGRASGPTSTGPDGRDNATRDRYAQLRQLLTEREIKHNAVNARVARYQRAQALLEPEAFARWRAIVDAGGFPTVGFWRRALSDPSGHATERPAPEASCS